MSFSRSQRAAVVAAAFVLCSTASAGSIPKRWSELPDYLKGKYVTVVRKGTTPTRGRVIETRPDALVIEDHGKTTIQRDSVMSLRVDIPIGNLRKLGRNLQGGYSFGVKHLFTPDAPTGLLALPAVTAYAIVAAPFCAIGDLFGERHEVYQETVDILPDPK